MAGAAVVVVVGTAVVVVVVVLVDVVVVDVVVVVVGAAVVVVVVVVGARVDVDVDVGSTSAVEPGLSAAASAGLIVGSSSRLPASPDGSLTADASEADKTERARASGTVVDVSAATTGSNTSLERALVDISDPSVPLHADARAATNTATRSVRRRTGRVDEADIATKHRRLPPIS